MNKWGYRRENEFSLGFIPRDLLMKMIKIIQDCYYFTHFHVISVAPGNISSKCSITALNQKNELNEDYIHYDSLGVEKDFYFRDYA